MSFHASPKFKPPRHIGLTYTEAVGASSRWRPRTDLGGGQGGRDMVEQSRACSKIPSSEIYVEAIISAHVRLVEPDVNRIIAYSASLYLRKIRRVTINAELYPALHKNIIQYHDFSATHRTAGDVTSPEISRNTRPQSPQTPRPSTGLGLHVSLGRNFFVEWH